MPRKFKFVRINSREESWKILHQIADSVDPRIRQAFVEAIANTRDGFQVRQVANLLAAGDPNEAIQLAILAWQQQGDDFRRRAAAAFLEIYQRTGDPALVAQLLPGRASIRFDVTNPNVFQAINNQADTLFATLDQNVKAAIAASVTKGFREGRTVFQIAQELRAEIGLNPRQVLAVENYRQFLNGLLGREDLDRLPPSVRQRLRRSDLRLFSAKSFTEGRINALVEGYRSRLIRENATSLARTSAIDASAKAQQELWRQAVEQGQIRPEIWEVKWIVTPDDRLCPRCQEMRDQRRDISGSYSNGVSGPTLHPQCRCAEGLVRKAERAPAPRPAVDPFVVDGRVA